MISCPEIWHFSAFFGKIQRQGAKAKAKAFNKQSTRVYSSDKVVMMQRQCTHLLSIIIFATGTVQSVVGLLLLSDLPTPSFIIDTDALHRRVAQGQGDGASSSSKILFAPPIRCPKNDLILNPSMIRSIGNRNDVSGQRSVETIICDFQFIEGQPALGYLHSSVTRAREDAITGEDDDTFLAEIDLDPALCGGDAQLVLGLNNHHVGGYYWARSAGAGSSMDAPGVSFGLSNGCSRNTNDDAKTKNNRGILRWLNEGGPTASNSNDGKRSEWVNFLRKGDTVQLVPADGQNALLQFSKEFGIDNAVNDKKDSEHTIRVFGISTKGRPMGSEPEVVCEWRSV